MSALHLEFQWRDVEGRSGPALRSTMADLAVFVDGQPVTRAFDAKARTTRDTVLVPLYPLAEWIASHWWALMEENHAPGRNEDGYQERHCLLWAGDGFAAPNLSLLPEGDVIRLIWKRHRMETQPIEFLSFGESRTSLRSVRDELVRFVETVIARLHAHGLDSTWLQKEWDRIQVLDGGQKEFCRAVARLGQDPFDVSDEAAEVIAEACSSVPKAVREDLLRCSSVEALGDACRWVRDGLARIKACDGGPQRWDVLRERAPRTKGQTPWEQGYELARWLRAELGRGDQPRLDLEAIADFRLPVVQGPEPPERSLEGLLATSAARAFYCFTGKRRGHSVRFLCARSIGLLLSSRDALPAILSSAVTQPQQRNRAFAAELLAPAVLLKEHLSSDEVTPEEVDDLSEQFDVSSFVVRHQISNHHLAHICE